ncbi:hypothetical protein AQ490_06890 [Wenjunlia vitaminophila]|uniref:GAF domain-containing protein n=1 Tax=Wenjunlia vitaminophila TaxID=76728 RepID=A0A0T6LP24_WENVI|nr:GAF domain-containing protein [Wenjunlia vitaminophila]KRV47612.1 hypothetical protein AQ490_06890 [Wenjunlia vitaminophila]
MKYDSNSGLYVQAEDTALEQRKKLLEELGLGDPDEEFDQFAAELARAAGTPYAMVNFIVEEQHFAGLHAPPGADVGRTMPRTHGFCPDVLDRRKPLVLPDVMMNPRFAGNPVVDQLGVRTYAGAPLIHGPTDTLLGTVCVIGPTQRPWSTGQPTLALIKKYRDTLMEIINQRTTYPTP